MVPTTRKRPLGDRPRVSKQWSVSDCAEQFYVQRIGADDFMKKPFSRAEVFNRIEALLDADDIPRHGSKPGTRAEAAAAAGES